MENCVCKMLGIYFFFFDSAVVKMNCLQHSHTHTWLLIIELRIEATYVFFSEEANERQKKQIENRYRSVFGSVLFDILDGNVF